MTFCYSLCLLLTIKNYDGLSETKYTGETNQEVDGVSWSDAAALNETECHGRHDVLHQVVT